MTGLVRGHSAHGKSHRRFGCSSSKNGLLKCFVINVVQIEHRWRERERVQRLSCTTPTGKVVDTLLMQAAELWTSAVRKAGWEGAGVWSGTGQDQVLCLQRETIQVPEREQSRHCSFFVFLSSLSHQNHEVAPRQPQTLLTTVPPEAPSDPSEHGSRILCLEMPRAACWLHASGTTLNDH
jgi:hypothetical protein